MPLTDAAGEGRASGGCLGDCASLRLRLQKVLAAAPRNAEAINSRGSPPQLVHQHKAPAREGEESRPIVVARPLVAKQDDWGRRA